MLSARAVERLSKGQHTIQVQAWTQGASTYLLDPLNTRRFIVRRIGS